MSDFFKVFKKTHDQDIRDFNMEFDRHLTKLKEIGCLLPGLCSSWWYVDKLRLDNSAELNLLASVRNQYDLRRLQEAAIVQDRMNRRIWENNNKRTNGKGDFKKNQQAFCTELDDAPDDEEDQDDLYDFSEPERRLSRRPRLDHVALPVVRRVTGIEILNALAIRRRTWRDLTLHMLSSTRRGRPWT